MKASSSVLSHKPYACIRRLAAVLYVTIALFASFQECLEERIDAPSPSSISNLKNSSIGLVDDEFSGLTLHYDRRRTQRNAFTTESLAIAAITAMKEEALKEYNAPLLDFDFLSILPPENPIRIIMHSAPNAPSARLTRSSVVWTLKSLSTELLRSRFLHPLVFSVKCWTADLYEGILASPLGQGGVSKFLAAPHSMSLAPTPTQNSTSMILTNISSSLHHDTNYQINFSFVPQVLSTFRIFESILSLLLLLAKEDAATVLRRIKMELREVQARIYIEEVLRPPPNYHFQQYHAVALLEAVARYYVLHDQYTEMTFELLMDGHLVAWGCVTRPLNIRRWCQHMFSDGRAGLAEPVATT
ncbi:MAG: hypothetical protein Q9166_008001 [cf. Caloplaca sp. 2 TL-2023]